MNSEKSNLQMAQEAALFLNYADRVKFIAWVQEWHYLATDPQEEANTSVPAKLNKYFEHARANMFPAMKDSAFVLSIATNEPDPKLCLEIGAAICFNKPILVVVPRGCSVPLSLRTIAHKIVEIDDMKSAQSQRSLTAAIKEMHDTLQFRSGRR